MYYDRFNNPENDRPYRADRDQSRDSSLGRAAREAQNRFADDSYTRDERSAWRDSDRDESQGYERGNFASRRYDEMTDDTYEQRFGERDFRNRFARNDVEYQRLTASSAGRQTPNRYGTNDWRFGGGGYNRHNENTRHDFPGQQSYFDEHFAADPNARVTYWGDYGTSRMFGVHHGKGPKGYTRSDDRIREDVCERLTRNGEIDATDIEITVDNGAVTLSGTVAERSQKYLAEDIAEAVSGVKDVHNHLKVMRAS